MDSDYTRGEDQATYPPVDPKSDFVLVTGSNGFIGLRVVESLIAKGFTRIRCFARPSRRVQRLCDLQTRHGRSAQLEVMTGDLANDADCLRATEGVAIVYHLAAGFDRSFEQVEKNSVLATQNLLRAFVRQPCIKRFVCVSSFSVYSNTHLARGAPLTEDCPLEHRPKERSDAYAYGKLRQEEVVRDFGRSHRLPFVVLRPGTVFGPGKAELTGRIGLKAGRIYVLISGSNLLPLTYVDNCAEAVTIAGIHPAAIGETFNVVDNDLLSAKQFLSAYRKRVGGFLSVPVPYHLAYLACTIAETAAKKLPFIPKSLNRRRCAAEWRGNTFSNRKLKELLGWAPQVSMTESMERFLDQFRLGT